jgi:hypothetical protein
MRNIVRAVAPEFFEGSPSSINNRELFPVVLQTPSALTTCLLRAICAAFPSGRAEFSSSNLEHDHNGKTNQP